jgi:cytochrome b561
MAHTEPSANSLRRLYCQRCTLITVYGCLTMLAVAVGVLGLMDASWPRKMLDSCFNIYAMFGLLLCGLVLARYQWCVEHSAPMLPADVRELSRHLSRIVYLFLYVVIGVRLSISIVSSLWHGGAVDFNLFDERFRHGPDGMAFDPRDDFRHFIASGLFALVFVRVLAYKMWLRSVERTARSNARELVQMAQKNELGNQLELANSSFQDRGGA